jgi:hypothetical protein
MFVIQENFLVIFFESCLFTKNLFNLMLLKKKNEEVKGYMDKDKQEFFLTLFGCGVNLSKYIINFEK